MDLTSWTPRMLSVLRIVTGLLFLEHGTGSYWAFPLPIMPLQRCSRLSASKGHWNSLEAF